MCIRDRSKPVQALVYKLFPNSFLTFIYYRKELSFCQGMTSLFHLKSVSYTHLLGDGISQVKDGADTLASSLADGADEVTSIHADEETDVYKRQSRMILKLRTDFFNLKFF